jgi:hypothetical protein
LARRAAKKARSQTTGGGGAMRIAKERLEVKPTFEGKDSASGWLQINLKGLDLDGVDRLVLDLTDLEGLRARQQEADDLFRKLRGTLGEGERG